MFTGIVETVGTVVDVSGDDAGRTFRIDAPPIGHAPIGSSIAVDGVCLTVVEADETGFSVQTVVETLTRTGLGSLEAGSSVNLERAMPAAGRFDGHIVQGHVDGTGTLIAIQEEGDGQRWTVEVPPALLRYIVEKGSITVNGVSLTVAALTAEGFEIALIPHTLSVTTFGEFEEGATLNLEVDILAKYMERLLERTT